MSCLCGSTKKPNAPFSFDTNNIGAFCVLFGLEGELCRLLDLIPEATTKLFSFNFAEEDTLDLFEDILKLVGKKAFGLLIDEITGQINTQSFCSSPPPELPPPPTFQDIFEYISESVPLLGTFFAVKDIALGDNTTLLEKVVGFWLYEKWFEFCECRKCDEDDPPTGSPPILGRCTTPQVNEQINFFIESLNARNRQWKENQNFSENCNQEAAQRAAAIAEEFSERGDTDISISVSQDEEPILSPVGEARIFFEGGTLIVTGNEEALARTPIYAITSKRLDPDGSGVVFNIRQEVNGCVKRVAGSQAARFEDFCPPPPIPEFSEEEKEEFKESDKEPEFCALFPNDPLCVLPENECELERVEVNRFVECGLKRPLGLVLNNGGEPFSTNVSRFAGCGNAPITQARELLACNSGNAGGITRVFGCTNTQSINYDPRATVDDGSCIERRSGCTDPEASNYDPLANEDDGTCIPVILGCTDPEALNFNPQANSSDDSCVYE